MCGWFVLSGAWWCLDSSDWERSLWSQSLLGNTGNSLPLYYRSGAFEQLKIEEEFEVDEHFWKLLATEPKPIM